MQRRNYLIMPPPPNIRNTLLLLDKIKTHKDVVVYHNACDITLCEYGMYMSNIKIQV